MRGGYVHNRVLLAPITQRATEIGFRVEQEKPIFVDGKILFGDLVIQHSLGPILVEAEMSPKRVENDLIKATALGAAEIWIVVPNANVAASVRRRVKRERVGKTATGVFVLLLPQALQRIGQI